MNILKEFSSAADVRTYVHGATYDSWNRVRTMTYPDGEVVTYHYDEAGQVSSLTSNKNGVESVIVDMMGYDELGHTVYTKLGNGTETTYAYDKQRQRLQEMELQIGGNQLMQNRYEYDKVDNILSLVNNINPQTLTDKNTAKLGGTSTHRYQYDELNRLIHADGTAKNASYSMAMTFNSMSMPLTKTQNVDSTETAQSYHNTYLYDDKEHPTAPTQIGNERYEYDANGNPTRVENDSLNTTRELYWDEDNRLMVLSDNGKTSRYTYNHAGERIVKSHGDMEGVYINGAPQGITFHETDEFTLYPASIISVNKNRFTKHYFIGSQRIASRIGSGIFNNVYGRNGCYVTAGQQDYVARLNQIEQQREDYYKELGIPPGVPTMKGAYGDPENTGVGYNTIITELGDHSVPKNWEQFVVKRGPGETPGPPIIWSDPQNPEDAQPGYGFIPDDTTEEETFFYHSDHLGSTSYITDQDGNITQYTAYLPYGELLVDEHSSSEEIPYKFNGKELDEETGLYYYGARYLNPTSSIWYGVDPLFEKYPSQSAYNYCASNPIRRIDIDGRDWVERTVNGVREIYYDRDVRSQRDINRLYGNKSGMSYIADKTTMTLEGNRYTFYNDNSENKYGRVAMNGRLQDNGNIIRGERFDIFGTTDNSCDARTLHRNLMGTSYTGPNNPKAYNEKDESYQYIPRNPSEIGSYVHDKAYDDVNAKGALDAFFNVTFPVMKADAKLVGYNLRNAKNSLRRGNVKEYGRSVATAAAFGAILIFKGFQKFGEAQVKSPNKL